MDFSLYSFLFLSLSLDFLVIFLDLLVNDFRFLGKKFPSDFLCDYFVLGALGLLGEIVWISHYLKHNCVPLYNAPQFHCESGCLPPQLYYILLSGAFSQFPSYMCTTHCIVWH